LVEEKRLKLYKTPILFLIFNRPDTTEKVFEAIKKIRPKVLYIAADGGRTPQEKEICEQARNLVINGVDWDCELHTLFRDENLGCKKSVASAITWFFDNVEEGLIIEDDTIPSESFFPFCEMLLEKYRNDEKIMHISGETGINDKVIGDGYYFSSIPLIWGWATWRRAWKYFDVEMSDYQENKKNKFLNKIFQNSFQRQDWLKSFDMTYDDRLCSWGFIWTYTVFKQNGLSIIPNTNMVTNIGYDDRGTHTFDPDSPLANKARHKINLDFPHPKTLKIDYKKQSRVLIERFSMLPYFSLNRYDFFKHNKLKREISRALHKMGIKF